MQPEQPPGTADDPPVLTRAVLEEHVQARLDGHLRAAKLAAWAFDQFYAYDTEALLFEQDAEDVMLEVLDTLMFADDPAFALDTSELQALLTRLRP